MFRLINQNLQGKKVLLFFLVTLIIHLTMVLFTISKLEAITNGLKIFDLRQFGYSFQEASLLINTLGKSGKSIYLYQQIPLDLIYPISYGISLCLILAYFLNKLGLIDSKYFTLSMLPLLIAFFDYLENFCVILILNMFPNISNNQVFLASNLTIIKSILTTLYFLVLIFVILKLAYQKFLHKSN
jgi:hypothetical protein